jgi:hypothetical protein
MCFLWGTNWIYICYVEDSRPSLWSSGQSSWLEIQRSGIDSRRNQIFWEVVCLKRGPLSLVGTTEELLGRNNNGSGLENREYGRGDPLRWPCDTLYLQKFPLTSPTSDGYSFGIVRSLTQATEFFYFNGGGYYFSLWRLICFAVKAGSILAHAFLPLCATHYNNF